MAESPENEEKQKLVVSLMVPFTQTGMTLKQIQQEYLSMIGEELMPSYDETIDFLKSIIRKGLIREERGLCFPNSKDSKHVADLVAGENQKKRHSFNNNSNYAPRRFYNPNQPSYPRGPPPNRRKSVCYEQEYIEVPKPQAPVQAPASARVQRRRMTMGGAQQFRPETPPRSRSRSNSPKRNNTFGRNYNHKRSQSPDSRTKRPLERSSRSPPAKRTRENRSPSRDRRPYPQHNQSPDRDRRRSRPRSPARDPRRRSRSPTESYTKDYSSHRERKTRQAHENVSSVSSRSATEATPPSQKVSGFSPLAKPVQAVTPQGSSQRVINERISLGEPKAGPSDNVRSFKFNLIGDGLLYNVVHEIDDTISLNPYLISPFLLIREAIQSVEKIILPKVHKKKCVIMSIGSTDLRSGTSLVDMRKQFLTLYRLCDNVGFKPLVTTISCMDTPDLVAKAKVFNEFLQQNFTNVIDLFKAVNGANGGLAQTLAKIRKSPSSTVQSHATLSIGMHSRLILKIEI